MVLDRGLVVLHALNDDCVTRVTSWFPAAKLNTDKVKKKKENKHKNTSISEISSALYI